MRPEGRWVIRVLTGFCKRIHRALILAAVWVFIELDIRKIVTMQLPKGHESAPIHPVLEIVREHFTAHFLLIPFYALIVLFPSMGFLGRLLIQNRIWVLPISLAIGFSYFITLEANIGLLLYWYRPGYQEVAFSMSLMPFALLVFLTQDARRLIRSLKA